MGQTTKQRQDDRVLGDGRDEMNLAEFPIASLSSRPSKGLKTLNFEDRIWDRSRNAWAIRRLTISASDRYGLPTALDDEVVLGLIQLTRETAFGNRHVFFSRYRLIRLLGWRNEGKSYTRLETSLKRWIGVTFYYENAWWNNDKACWVDESFHILERLSIYDRRRRARLAADNEPALSMFTWNEAVFRSFQAGYLKRIDMELFRRLRSPVAKRLYRLLDKRFYHKDRWRFDLREMACEHVGLSRNYDAAGLKRKLRPAIVELESAGYLKSVDPDERFLRVGRGQWQVCFDKESPRRRRTDTCDATEQVKTALLRRKVNPVTVDRLLADHPVESIRRQVEAVDWLRKQGNGQALKNPAGFLVQSIRNGYEIPLDSSEPGGHSSHDAQISSRQSGRRKKTQEPDSRVHARIDRYLKSLDVDKRRELEKRAIASAEPPLAEAYRRALTERAEPLVQVYRRVILERHLAATGLIVSEHTRSSPRN